MKYDFYFLKLEAFWQKRKRWIISFLLILAVFAIIERQKQKPITAKTAITIQERVVSHLSKWNGSHRELEAYIKASMNDPGSYEHIETKYILPADTATSAIYITTFRGKNAFGGVVTQTVRARCNIYTGKVEEIISR